MEPQIPQNQPQEPYNPDQQQPPVAPPQIPQQTLPQPEASIGSPPYVSSPKKKHRRSLFVIIAIVFIALIGGALLPTHTRPKATYNTYAFSYTNKTKDVPLKLTTYKDPHFGVSFDIPHGWTVMQNAKPEVPGETTIVPPGDAEMTLDGSLESVNIICKDYPTGPANTQAFYGGIAKQQLPKLKKIRSFTGLEDEKHVVINGYPAVRYTEKYNDLVAIQAAPGSPSDLTGTVYYQTYYLVGAKRICNLYERIALYSPSYSMPSPLAEKVDEIANSFKLQ